MSPAQTDALTDPTAYAEVYQQHLPLIQAVVRRSGCPAKHLDDVTSEVILAILSTDGLSRYDPSRSSLRTYLATFAAVVARGVTARILIREARQVAMDWDFDKPESDQSGLCFEEFLDALLAACPDDDSRTFVRVAEGSPSYAKARAELVAQGWVSNRIRRTVRRTRAALRPVL